MTCLSASVDPKYKAMPIMTGSRYGIGAIADTRSLRDSSHMRDRELPVCFVLDWHTYDGH